MNLNRKNIGKIRGLILFTALMVLGLMKFDLLCSMVVFLVGILRPFIVGGMIAFVINIPMSFFERIFFGKEKEKAKPNKILLKGSRGISLIMAYLAVVLVITLVIVTVIPQLAGTIRVLTNKIPAFWDRMIGELEVIFAANPALIELLGNYEELEIDWKSLFNTVVSFLQNGVGSVLGSTFSVASSIISSTVNFFISLIFSIYILVQKEKLGNQFDRVLKAYTSHKVYKSTRRVLSLLHRNFSNFITGQCTEAVILGLMFVVSMTLLRFDYAVMIGVMDGLRVILSQPAELTSGYIPSRVHKKGRLSAAFQGEFTEFQHLALHHKFYKFLLIAFHFYTSFLLCGQIRLQVSYYHKFRELSILLDLPITFHRAVGWCLRGRSRRLLPEPLMILFVHVLPQQYINR